LIVIFLKSCQHFQALTWPCQARLLRKNIAEISLILTTMCLHREQQMFRKKCCGRVDGTGGHPRLYKRWGMSERDQTMAARRGAHLGPVVEVDETTLSAHLTESISKDIFHMVSSLALLDIPNHIHILLILIQVFTRDGQQMEKQVLELRPSPANSNSSSSTWWWRLWESRLPLLAHGPSMNDVFFDDFRFLGA